MTRMTFTELHISLNPEITDVDGTPEVTPSTKFLNIRRASLGTAAYVESWNDTAVRYATRATADIPAHNIDVRAIETLFSPHFCDIQLEGGMPTNIPTVNVTGPMHEV